jgi:hypothetical protein
LHRVLAQVTALLAAGTLAGATRPITTPKQALGFELGDDYHVANYSQLEAWWKVLASESDRLKLVDIGLTAENRHQYMAVISLPENLRQLGRWKQISARLGHAQGLNDEQARALAREGKAVVWIDGGLHATETVGSQQLMAHVYEMLTRNDPETLRFLNDDIQLCVLANPDGQELVANWYMRETDPKKRSLSYLPQLFQHYIGHDNNRDFYMSNMPETINMNRQMFLEWFPQIVYNHHQTGPAGAVIFMPPFRDPFNYNFDPLIPLGVEAVGTAMHERLVAEGKGGSAQRSGANYSTWWNGGLRTVGYFHNVIGILTEIIGNPTPIEIPLVADKQLPRGDWPLPIAPQIWHYRQSIEYELTNNRAILDYASRNRETLLYNFYLMGRNSIRNGNGAHWTITPDRIEALRAAAGALRTPPPLDLYERVLHDPAHRDPRGYIITSDQPDFATATRFVNALLKTGIIVQRATAGFAVNGKSYPAGSYVVKTAQAFRPQIMDMFEPQHHPNDFEYPGGPPIPPYDSAGWTLALQMGVAFDRILDGFDGPFQNIGGLLAPPPAIVTNADRAQGFLLSHRENNSFIVVNRLLKAKCAVYWSSQSQTADGKDLGMGAVWVPATSTALPILERAAKDLGVTAYGLAEEPRSLSYRLKPVRIGLYDQYGGLMSSGWDRWLFEQYEFPFEVVYPQDIEEGKLNSRFGALVFTDGAFSETGEHRDRQPKPEQIPAEYRARLGRITQEKTVPQLKQFVEAGGMVVAVGGATRLGEMLGLPVENHLTEMGGNGQPRALPREKFYIPGSLLKAAIDNTDPLAYGMQDSANFFFDNSPVFGLRPDASQRGAKAVSWFAGASALVSGWAWGQQYLNGGAAVVEANLGKGTVILLGPEVTFRAQPHATFKLLFNALDLSAANYAVRTESMRHGVNDIVHAEPHPER